MKKLIVVLALLVLTVTACGGGSKPAVQPPASNPDGKVLYYTDFSRNDKDWDEGVHDQDEIKVRDGELTISVQTLNWDMWTNPNDLKIENYVVVDVDAKRVSGPEDGTYGVICDYQDRDNYYGLIVGDDGYSEIYRWTDGIYETLASKTGVAMNKAGMNHLTARCESSQVSLLVNNSPVLQADHSGVGTGNVGLIAGAFDPSNVLFAFDNFMVSSLP